MALEQLFTTWLSDIKRNNRHLLLIQAGWRSRPTARLEQVSSIVYHDSAMLSGEVATKVMQSRWDEIRGANTGQSRTSTWDAIRQKHERNQTVKSQTEDRGDDRSYEQAKFDEMLERERNLSKGT